MNDATVTDNVMTDVVVAEPISDSIDDLFGETTDILPTDSLGVSLRQIPIPGELLIRLNDFQRSGCSTRLDFANTGSIAQITEDGKKIEFCALLRNNDNGTWNLTKPPRQYIDSPEHTVWRHIQFSGIGIDLAAVDSNGTVHIYSLIGALGKMVEVTQHPTPWIGTSPDLDCVVGLHWLPVSPTEFKVPYISPAQKVGTKWITGLTPRDPNEQKVHHPVDMRHAALSVSKGAKLTLTYQNDGVWQSVSLALESSLTSEHLLTHAAMCEGTGHILLATHDCKRRLRLYRVAIAWNLTQQQRPGAQSTSMTVAPTLDLTHMTWCEGLSVQGSSEACLTHLKLLPPLLSAANPGIPSFPTVIAVYNHVALPTAALPTANFQQAEHFSIISRWNIVPVKAALHSAFGNPSAKAASTGPGTLSVLQRQEDIVSSRIILALQSQYYNTSLAFVASDGTVEFRDRTTMAAIETTFETTMASSLAQCGFEQLPLLGEHAIEVSASLNGSAMVYKTTDGELRWKAMTFNWQPIEGTINDSDSLIQAAIVCLAREYAVLCCSNAAMDDVLALLPLDLDPSLRRLFFKETLRMTVRALDIATQDSSRQQTSVLKDPLLPRLVSANCIMGFKCGSASVRNVVGNFSNCFLNLRFLCTSIAPSLGRADLPRPDLLNSLRGLVKWAIDLLVYFADSITAARRSFGPPGSASEEGLEEFIQSTENPSMHLLLSAFTRFEVRYLTTLIPKYILLARRVIVHSRSIQERQQLMEIIEYYARLPFKCAQFESLIGELDNAIRTAYSSSGTSPEKRADIEAAIMCGETSFPQELMTAIRAFFDHSVPKFMAAMDYAKLYFWDTEWLTLSGPASVQCGNTYDGIKKLPFRKGMKLRVCRRCGLRMEDVSQEKTRELPMWYAHAQRYCLCLNYWVLANNND